ncbi:MAG: ABC transporter permease subunit [Kastovskya adunca ATA6-11-RM4]|nr:ABC transporter permease subunit [Kastovskya adunca ATA6-11-RM4]
MLWWLVLLGAIAFSLYQAGLFQQDLLNLGGLPLLWRFLRASVQPDLSPELLAITLDATLVTLAYAVCGTFLSLLIGIVGGVLASEVWWLAVFPRHGGQRTSWLGMRVFLTVPRAIHELIWGLFFINIWGLDPLTAILAIAIPFGAITAKVFSEILDETPRQSLFALLNSGVKPLTAFTYSLLPQAFLNLLSYSFYRFECSIRSAAVLGIIGAGGLGYQILLSLQSLRYQQLWTFFYALLLLNGLVDLSSALLRHRLGCASRLDLNLRKLSRSSPPVYRRDPVVNLASLGVLLLVPFCFGYIKADFSKLWSPRTQQLLGDIAQSSFPPDLGGTPLSELLTLSIQTVAMSILAIAVAGFGGLLLSFPAAYNFFLPGGILNPGKHNQFSGIWAWFTLLFTRAILLLCRAIPAPIWALVALFVIFPGILPGAIALGLHNLGILGRLMAEVNENLEKPPLQALKAQGTPGALVFLYGVLPLSLPRFLAYALYRWEVCMRETVIVGLVGAGGLGRLLTEQLSSFDYRAVVVTLGCFMILTFMVDWVSAIARRSLR